MCILLFFIIRVLPNEQLRAVLHKLLQRETPAILQREDTEERAGAVQEGRTKRSRDPVRRQPGLHR